jgi:hypothetical protein
MRIELSLYLKNQKYIGRASFPESLSPMDLGTASLGVAQDWDLS